MTGHFCGLGVPFFADHDNGLLLARRWLCWAQEQLYTARRQNLPTKGNYEALVLSYLLWVWDEQEARGA